MKVIRDTDQRRLGFTNTAAIAVFSGIAIPLQRNKKTRKCLFWFGLFCGFTVRFPSLPVSSFHKLFTHELRTLSLQCNTVLLHVKHLFCWINYIEIDILKHSHTHSGCIPIHIHIDSQIHIHALHWTMAADNVRIIEEKTPVPDKEGNKEEISQEPPASDNRAHTIAADTTKTKETCPSSPLTHPHNYHQAYLPHLTPQPGTGYYLYHQPQVTPEPPSDRKSVV